MRFTNNSVTNCFNVKHKNILFPSILTGFNTLVLHYYIS
jgi:hypothetical protein